MDKQRQVYEQLRAASAQMTELWKSAYDNFEVTGVSKGEFLNTQDQMGGVKCNLHNFSHLSFVPRKDRDVPPDELEWLNESAWQQNQRDPNYHQRLRIFFPNGRIPTSMDMTRLGLAFLAETNLLRLTTIPIALDRKLDPALDPVKEAHAIVNAPPPAGHSKEWSKRLKNILDNRTEEFLRSGPNFAIFVAAVKNFLDDFEAGK